MRVAILGGGFVGVATALFYADGGHRVTLVEPNPVRADLLASGRAPFREPGVDARLRRDVERLRLHVDRRLPLDVSFQAYVICVGTPAGPRGLDLRAVRLASTQVGRHLHHHAGRPLVFLKSTVPPGTLEEEVVPRIERASGRRADVGFHAVSNPEFLREGAALRDTFRPDRVVVGARKPSTRRRAARHFQRLRCPIVETDPRTAEFVKYAANAFLALKISYANEMARLASAVGVDVYEVMHAVGLDPRIGTQFLRAGAGFGGSCFPKDVRGLAALARRMRRPSRLAEAVLAINDSQGNYVLDLAERAVGGLEGRRVALLGLSFKPDTDDVRETRALPLYRGLRERGARVTVWDPVATANFQALVGEKIRAAPSLREAVRGADLALIQTEWRQIRSLRAADLKRWMRRAIVVDGRRTLDPEALERAGVAYFGVGWRREPRRRA